MDAEDRIFLKNARYPTVQIVNIDESLTNFFELWLTTEYETLGLYVIGNGLSLNCRLGGLPLPFKGVVAPWCNPLTLQPEQSGGVGSNSGRAPPLEHHDKWSRTRLGLLYFCDASPWR